MVERQEDGFAKLRDELAAREESMRAKELEIEVRTAPRVLWRVMAPLCTCLLGNT